MVHHDQRPLVFPRSLLLEQVVDEPLLMSATTLQPAVSNLCVDRTRLRMPMPSPPTSEPIRMLRVFVTLEERRRRDSSRLSPKCSRVTTSGTSDDPVVTRLDLSIRANGADGRLEPTKISSEPGRLMVVVVTTRATTRTKATSFRSPITETPTRSRSTILVECQLEREVASSEARPCLSPVA